MANKITSGLIIFLWIVIGIYTGTASLITTKKIVDYEEAKKIKQIGKHIDTTAVIYDHIPFANEQEMNNYINDLKYSYINKWFDWSESIPDFLILILGACSFGLLGCVLRILYEHVFKIKLIHESNYFSFPLLGFLSGFISIGVSYLLPSIFLEVKTAINPVGLILFSLFFGYFIKEFLDKISNQLFNSKKP